MSPVRVPPFLFAVVAAACGDRTEPRAEPGDTTTVDSAALRAAADSAELVRGLAVHGAACAECHTTEAPPKTAPPMASIARRYREHFAEREEALEHLIQYTKSPDLARSLLEQRALDEWGVMPAVPLPDADLHAVARWIWELGAGLPR